MNLLGAALYDPTTAASKSTASLIAMTAIDTTNLRLTVTVPAHGLLRFVLKCAIEGATTFPRILLGVLNGATVVGRVSPLGAPDGTALATTDCPQWAEFTATGLTPGSASFDAAYGVEVVVAATNIKYGGPNNTTTDDAWGAFVFEIWDPRPLPTAAPGASTGVLISGTNTGPMSISGGVSFTNSTGDGFTCSSSGSNGKGINASGNGSGAGIISTGGATGIGFNVVGGATSGDGIGITTTSGHAINATATGTSMHGINAQGGATTSHGIKATGGGVGHGILATSGGGATGDGIKAVAASTNGNGLEAIGAGTGAGELTSGGATGIGFSIVGGGTSGDGIKVTTTSGHGINLAPVGTSMHGALITGGNGGTSDGIKAVAGTGGVDLRANITGNLVGTVSTLTTYTGNTVQTGDSYARLGAPTAASISADIAEIEAETDDIAAIKTQTDKLVFTVANQVDANVLDWKSAAAPAMTGDAFARLGAPVGASISADIAEVEAETDDIAAIKTQTDKLAFTVANQIDANVLDWKGAAAPAMTGDAYARLGAPAGASTAADIAAVKADSAAILGDLPQRITKNIALAAFPFVMLDSADHVTGKTGLAITATRAIDGAPFGACTNAATEIASGWYKIDLSAADLNGNTIALKFTAAGADQQGCTIVTEPD